MLHLKLLNCRLNISTHVQPLERVSKINYLLTHWKGWPAPPFDWIWGNNKQQTERLLPNAEHCPRRKTSVCSCDAIRTGGGTICFSLLGRAFLQSYFRRNACCAKRSSSSLKYGSRSVVCENYISPSTVVLDYCY